MAAWSAGLASGVQVVGSADVAAVDGAFDQPSLAVQWAKQIATSLPV